MFKITETFKKDSPNIIELVTNYIKSVINNEQNDGVILYFYGTIQLALICYTKKKGVEKLV